MASSQPPIPVAEGAASRNPMPNGERGGGGATLEPRSHDKRREDEGDTGDRCESQGDP